MLHFMDTWTTFVTLVTWTIVIWLFISIRWHLVYIKEKYTNAYNSKLMFCNSTFSLFGEHVKCLVAWVIKLPRANPIKFCQMPLLNNLRIPSKVFCTITLFIFLNFLYFYFRIKKFISIFLIDKEFFAMNITFNYLSIKILTFVSPGVCYMG